MTKQADARPVGPKEDDEPFRGEVPTGGPQHEEDAIT